MRLEFHTLDVFTRQIFGGNPLAVFPDATGLDDAQMQTVAAEFNLSETTFVFPQPDPLRPAVRIFTPRMELPFAGHPTVGTALLLARLGVFGEASEVVLQERVGPVEVRLERQNGQPHFAQLSVAQTPVFGPDLPPRQTLAEVLGLSPEDLLDEAQAVSCGTPFALIPLRSLEALGRVRVNLSAYHSSLAQHPAPHIYAFHQTAPTALRARMFAPLMGIAEDPATGAAAANLAGYLAQHSPQTDGTLSWEIRQGLEMGRPSQIFIEADKRAGRIGAVRVGGSAVEVTRGVLEF